MNSFASIFLCYVILAAFLQLYTMAFSTFSGFWVSYTGCINYAIMPVITRSKAKLLCPSIHGGTSSFNSTGTSIHETNRSIHEPLSPDTSLFASNQDPKSTDLSFTFVNLGEQSSKIFPPSSW